MAGKLTNPGIGTLDPDEPVLRYVDLSTTHISEAVKLSTPTWARTIVPGPRGAPLLYAGNRDGIGAAVLAFEPRRSDLPLQVAFPILLANLTGELLGSSTAPTEAVDPGTPVELHIPVGAMGLTVTRPDGAKTDLVPSSTAVGASAVTYADDGPAGGLHGQPDRRLRCLGDADHERGPSTTPSASPTAEPSTSPGAVGSAGGR